jgi:RNA polymerase sigma-70 factor (ECF subfamily)
LAGLLIALTRQRLDARVRQKVDPEGIRQSALKTFFQRHAAGQFELADWDGLWALLVTLTLRKCGHQVERYRAACRDVQREQAAAALADAEAWQALASDPTPSQAALLSEAVEQLLASLRDERERQIAVLALQGATIIEISTEVGRSERTVKRVLAKVRNYLQGLRDQPATAADGHAP